MENPLNLVDQFKLAVNNFKPEKLATAFNHFANTIIEWHRDFLLHADRLTLTQFFRKIAEMAVGDRVAPVVDVIHRLSGFVAREGDDAAVETLNAALAPVVGVSSQARPVSTAVMHGQRWAREAYEGEVRRGFGLQPLRL